MESELHSDASEVNQPTTTGDVDTTLKGSDTNVNFESNPGDVVRNLQNVTYMYRQDVVRSNSSGKIGIVTEIAGDSDSDSSITDDEDEDDEDDNDEEASGNEEGGSEGNENSSGRSDSRDPLPSDQVRVLWMDESETTQKISDVTVVDRGFLHGDFVAAVSDPTGQVGVVVDVNISVDLLTTDGSVMKDVSSRDLKRVRDFTVGDYVVLGPWLGRIDDVVDNVTVSFDDGSVCKAMKVDPLRLKPVGRMLMEDGHFPYYPGQRVKASSSSVFKNSRWLSGLWKPNRLEGTVTKVTVGSVFIYWIASAGYGPDSSTTPAEEQSPKNLKLLSCFAYANWQLGDWCLFPSPPLSSSVFLDKGLSKLGLHECGKGESDSTKTGPDCDSEVVSQDEANRFCESMDVEMENVLDGSSRNVDGNASQESSTCSSSLSVSKEPVQETWPLHRKKIRKVVIRRDKKSRKKEESFERALLIINTKTRVDVAWQDGTTGCLLDSTTLIPVDSPGDHEFVAEQYVVEKATDDNNDSSEVRRVGVVKSVNAKERTACVRWFKPVVRAEDPREFEKEEVVSVYELEGHPDYDYCYGDVVVRLLPVSVTSDTAASGGSAEEAKLMAGPNNVERDPKKHLGHEETEGASTNEACMDFSDLSWVGNITGLRNGDIEVTWADGMVSTVGPQAIYVVGRDDDESIAGGSEVSDDAASWETFDDDQMDALENANEEIELRNATDISPASEESENSVRNGALSIPLAALGYVTRLASGIFSRGRKHFDPLSLDHTRENEVKAHGMENIPIRGDSGHESSSHISTEIHGPETTQTSRGDEHDDEAKDLLDAAEALCSLKPEAHHAPSQSGETISSFKGFDIAKDPLDHHFLGANGQNNAGRKWLKKVQQDWNILQNNLPDGVYVRVYEDRMDLLRAVIVGPYGTPYQDGLFFFDFHLPPEYPDVPPDFEDLVREHFRRRGYYILKACDAYMKGYLIGSLTKDASLSDRSIANANSVGFKLMMAKIVPKLLLSLNVIGADYLEGLGLIYSVDLDKNILLSSLKAWQPELSGAKLKGLTEFDHHVIQQIWNEQKLVEAREKSLLDKVYAFNARLANSSAGFKVPEKSRPSLS
ncbi:hypothetical protein C3L33_19487, partial [Rhododendron williamsianum]